MSSHDYSIDQASDVRPPRVGQVIALTVDATSRGYDISSIAWNGIGKTKTGNRNHFYLSMQCETNDVYFALDRAAASVNSIDDTSVIAAGGTLALPTVTSASAAPDYIATYGAAVPPSHLVAGLPPIDIRIDRGIDVTLIVKCASTKSATLRIWPSSKNDQGAE